MAEHNAPASNADDVPETIDLDIGNAIERIDSWVDGLVTMLPNIVTALIITVIFYGIARLVKRLLVKQLGARARQNLGEVLGGLIKWVILVAGFLLAATVVVPTLRPGDLIAGLGVSSVAIGFAFKDILQNWLAGLLILLRQPFQTNDQIEVNGHEGTVEQIETRATIIKTYDAQRIVIPNSDIYTNAVLVKTAHPERRSQYDIGIGYSDDLEGACRIIVRALEGVEGVKSEPAPEALAWDLAASWVTIRARWWTDSRRADVVKVRADVIAAVKQALDSEGVDMPYETYIQLLHDQTEEGDGDRESQREGWPSNASKRVRPRWRAQRDD